MATKHSQVTSEQQPVIAQLEDFDDSSGGVMERLLFNRRGWVVACSIIFTLAMGWQFSRLQLNASFEEMIPTHQPYIVNFLKHKADLGALGNSIDITVEDNQGTIFNRQYLLTLRQVSDAVSLLPEVNHPFMKSLWTANARWISVTKDGLAGGTVVPTRYDGSDASIERVRVNVANSGLIGQLVSNDMKSSVIHVPLFDVNPQTGRPLDYAAFNHELDQILHKYNAPGVTFHVVGFARLMGDLIAGLHEILAFFLVAMVIAGSVLLVYTRCVRSTLTVVGCTLVAVLWELGIASALGFQLNPYSILVPFLIFAIGMSHGAQKMNGILQDIGRGTHKVVAARYTFRRLFVPGATALLCDAVGFVVLVMIRIKAIQDLAIIASIGVALLIFTNLMLLPIMFSYIGVSSKAAKRSLRIEEETARKSWQWRMLDHFTKRRWATVAVLVGAGLAVGGLFVGQHLQVGDLDPGAPELRPDSTYNRDVAYMAKHYSASSDVFVVMVTTPPDHCSDYLVEYKTALLSRELEQLPGVQSARSLADLSRLVQVSYDEGNYKWYALVPNRGGLAGARTALEDTGQTDFFNRQCSLLGLYVSLKDHKAGTLSSVVDLVSNFARKNDTSTVHFQMAAGNAGIEAATNIVVSNSMGRMLYWVYAAVILLAWITFRSWRGVVAAVLPLIVTSILADALMVALNMGVKVSTLPVTAIGVGIGVDYALYVLSVMLAHLRRGDSVSESYYGALQFTGKIVLLTGFELAIAVGTWIFSPIKFQADMGLLLAFMFIWNMIGALVLLPSLMYFLFPKQRTAKPLVAAG